MTVVILLEPQRRKLQYSLSWSRHASFRTYNGGADGLDAEVRDALAARFGVGRVGSPDRALDRSAVALGLIYFSAFFSLLFQIRGLIGPQGIFPAHDYLSAIAHSYGCGAICDGAYPAVAFERVARADGAVLGRPGGVRAGDRQHLAAGNSATLLDLLSFVRACGGRICRIISRTGCSSSSASLRSFLRRLGGCRDGAKSIRLRARVSTLLQFEWFRIYFESGVAKVMGGDPEWRHFTAMDEYYQNGPLPTWIGWYVQHLPHWFHATTVVATLVMELAIVWMMFLPRRWRIVCFFIVTPWEIGVILTANYTFLNYLVLVLGFLLLDDGFLEQICAEPMEKTISWRSGGGLGRGTRGSGSRRPFDVARNHIACGDNAGRAPCQTPLAGRFPAASARAEAFRQRRAVCVDLLCKCGFAAWMFASSIPLPVTPVQVLARWRIANEYGLFGSMTRARYEIEFQGSDDDGKDLADLSFQIQTAGSRESSGNLCALPAAL